MASSKCLWQCPEDWSEWSQWLAAGLHARNRWRLPILLVGILFAHGRRTVTTWLRAAGVSSDYQDYYYFLAALGRKTNSVATRLAVLVLETLPLPDRLLAVIDDTPTKRYGPKVEGADIHRNPTPGPADQKYLYGHIWVTLSLAMRHPCFGALALPLRAMLYVRRKTMAKIPKCRVWAFATKLVLAARLVEWIAPIVKQAGKTLWIVVDGGYAKAPFLRRAVRAGVTVMGRLRKDAALRDLPRKLRRGQRRGPGRPPKYGKNRISLAKRAAHREGWEVAQCTVYGQTVTKLYKTFLATYRPAGGVIRVVIVLEDHDWLPFFSTDPAGHGRGDHRSLRRPRHDRAGFPRYQGSLGHGPTASTEHLDQLGRLSSQSLDSHAGGTLVLEPPPRPTLRPQPVPMGRRRSPPVSCRSPQSLAATRPASRIIGACHRPAAATENPPVGAAPDGFGLLI
jgi:hypothetical protein